MFLEIWIISQIDRDLKLYAVRRERVNSEMRNVGKKHSTDLDDIKFICVQAFKFIWTDEQNVMFQWVFATSTEKTLLLLLMIQPFSSMVERSKV